MAKAGTLLSYQSYLAQARSWKAARKTVPAGALSAKSKRRQPKLCPDTRDLAMSALRMISQRKQAEQLDRIMDFAIAGIHAGGPAQIKDLWAHVANDPSARQAMKDQGLTDDLFAAMNDAMSKMDGQLYLKGGKLAMDVTATGQDEVRSVVFKRSAAGQPSNLHDLLTRGQFESMVDQFSQPGAVPLDLMTGAHGRRRNGGFSIGRIRFKSCSWWPSTSASWRTPGWRLTLVMIQAHWLFWLQSEGSGS